MKTLIITIFFTILTLTPQVVSAGNHAMTQEVKEALAELDSAIARKATYMRQAQERISRCEEDLKGKSGKAYIDGCKRLFDAVAHTDGRKALEVLDMIQQTDSCKRDPHLHTWCVLQRAGIMSTIGLHGVAQMILWPIDLKQLSGEDLHFYYHTLYNNLIRINQFSSNVSSRIGFPTDSMKLVYLDSLIAHQTADESIIAYTIEKQMMQGDTLMALQKAVSMWYHTQGLLRLRLGYAIANAYKGIGDIDKQMYYLAKITTQDIAEARTDYKGLPLLVQALFDIGEIDRAYRYLLCMMEDANLYPSQPLQLEIAQCFPLVNSRYSAYKSFEANNEKLRKDSLFLTYSLLVIALLTALYLGWRYNNTKKEKRRADQLQRALEQAAVADRVKTVFIQNMRHEIRTPLNAIMGFAQLMSNDLSEEERTEYNSYIQESNNQLLSTLDDIIDVSNMEVGTFNFQFADTSIDDLCRGRMEDVNSMLSPGVQLLYETNAPGLTIYTDFKRIGQVIYNLLSNACKNTMKGSITLSVQHQQDNISFTVTDTGVGVPHDKAEVIFEHFEKIDSYSPGLGLGLYVCNLIANALGGTIRLNTDYTSGAEFVFTVPVKQKNSEQQQ